MLACMPAVMAGVWLLSTVYSREIPPVLFFRSNLASLVIYFNLRASALLSLDGLPN